MSVGVEFDQGAPGDEPWPVDDGHPDPQQDALTNAQLRAAAIAITGALTDQQLRAAALAVTGPLTDTQLRAAALAVTGPLTATQLAAMLLQVNDGHPDPQRDALTNAQLRAAAVVITGALTDAQLRANPVAVSDGHPDPQTNGLTNTQLRAAAVAISSTVLDAIKGTLDNRFVAGKSSYAALLATAGDTAILTPSAGKRLQVYWVTFIPNGDNSVSNLVTVKFATSGQNLYKGYALSHSEVFTGAVGEPLTVNLANVQPVAVTVHYMEV